jgi:hypothetical protein
MTPRFGIGHGVTEKDIEAMDQWRTRSILMKTKLPITPN